VSEAADIAFRHLQQGTDNKWRKKAVRWSVITVTVMLANYQIKCKIACRRAIAELDKQSQLVWSIIQSIEAIAGYQTNLLALNCAICEAGREREKQGSRVFARCCWMMKVRR